jgi:cell division protein FtsW (lipid II flippase)
MYRLLEVKINKTRSIELMPTLFEIKNSFKDETDYAVWAFFCFLFAILAALAAFHFDLSSGVILASLAFLAAFFAAFSSGVNFFFGALVSAAGALLVAAALSAAATSADGSGSGSADTTERKATRATATKRTCNIVKSKK